MSWVSPNNTPVTLNRQGWGMNHTTRQQLIMCMAKVNLSLRRCAGRKKLPDITTAKRLLPRGQGMVMSAVLVLAVLSVALQIETCMIADAFAFNVAVAPSSPVGTLGAADRLHRSYPSLNPNLPSTRRIANRKAAEGSGILLHHRILEDVHDDGAHALEQPQTQPQPLRSGRTQSKEDEESASPASDRNGKIAVGEASPFLEEEASLSRRGVLGHTGGLVAGLLVGGVTAAPMLAYGDQKQEQQQQEPQGGEFQEYASPDGSFALRYPANFKAFSKPLKTHKVEVNFKSEEIKGYEVGVAIDPVRIASLEKFGTPEEVGARVLKVEQGKDGTLDTKLFDSRAEKQGELSLYTLDYFVESTRGFKHFVAKVTILDNLLYACTAQAKEKDYPEVQAQLNQIVESFRVPA